MLLLSAVFCAAVLAPAETVACTASIGFRGSNHCLGFALDAETIHGKWTTAGRFDPVKFGGTNPGVLLAGAMK